MEGGCEVLDRECVTPLLEVQPERRVVHNDAHSNTASAAVRQTVLQQQRHVDHPAADPGLGILPCRQLVPTPSMPIGGTISPLQLSRVVLIVVVVIFSIAVIVRH